MPAGDWGDMYRKGISGGSIARLCDDDPLEVLQALAAARRQDPTLEHPATPPIHEWAARVREQLAVELAGLENVTLIALAGEQYRCTT
ncbi:hypothetical protein GCM10009825_12020 [Arthrobacter humicola]|uniref:Uncharacterized protein n=1 Tax=Arthrobacter humicola TaxID=409291 RepID=A0ABN2YQ33_9MICC